MKSTMEILTKLQENSQKNHDEIFTRLYRYLLRPDIYFIAYQHLYSNKGAGTKGVNDDTADGFSEQYVTAIIEALRTGSYEPKPVRRTYDSSRLFSCLVHHMILRYDCGGQICQPFLLHEEFH